MMKTVEQVKKGVDKIEELCPEEMLGFPVIQNLHSSLGKVLFGALLFGRKRIPVFYSFRHRKWIDKKGNKYSGFILNHT